jgi:predicted amidohydrolase
VRDRRQRPSSGLPAKNQLDPSEDQFYVPGTSRRLFEVNDVKFGVVTCHEGWRYPETVRWAAVRGAKIVFHPQHTGNEQKGLHLTEWGASSNPYYEKAMMMRSIENSIWFASVNYALRFQEAATSLIDPSGPVSLVPAVWRGRSLVESIDVNAATGLLASRFAPDRYQQAPQLL